MSRGHFHIYGKPIRVSEDVYDDVLGGFEYMDWEADRFVVSSVKNKKLVCFDTWSRLEDLLSERLSFEEYCYLDQLFLCDGMDMDNVDRAVIHRFKEALSDFRMFY